MKFLTFAFNRTKRNWNILRGDVTLYGASLLIAPKGIEITDLVHGLGFFFLLIAPKGIEINVADLKNKKAESFNRTKRNWNFLKVGSR